ncbi:erythromycin esterase family protein [Nocardioides pyridinolyticus]
MCPTFGIVGPELWNVRDTHMADTVDRLLEHYEAQRPDTRAKAVVWEHNTPRR